VLVPSVTMGIAQSLLSAWSSAVEPSSSTRFLKISIESEQAVLALEVPSQSSSAKDDFALIEQKGNISPSEACYILYKLDKGKGWLFITYVSSRLSADEPALVSSGGGRAHGVPSADEEMAVRSSTQLTRLQQGQQRSAPLIWDRAADLQKSP
jgi:hypothetical protein